MTTKNYNAAFDALVREIVRHEVKRIYNLNLDDVGRIVKAPKGQWRCRPCGRVFETARAAAIHQGRTTCGIHREVKPEQVTEVLPETEWEGGEIER